MANTNGKMIGYVIGVVGLIGLVVGAAINTRSYADDRESAAVTEHRRELSKHETDEKTALQQLRADMKERDKKLREEIKERDKKLTEQLREITKLLRNGYKRRR